jgi:hypothetical protein
VVDSLKQAPTPKPQPSSFKALLRAEIDKAMPKTLGDTEKFMDGGQANAMKGSLGGNVEQQKASATGPVEQASKKTPGPRQRTGPGHNRPAGRADTAEAGGRRRRRHAAAGDACRSSLRAIEEGHRAGPQGRKDQAGKPGKG